MPGFILGIMVKPANIHASQVFQDLFDQLKDTVCRPKIVAGRGGL
jgi:hypothetical protein